MRRLRMRQITWPVSKGSKTAVAVGQILAFPIDIERRPYNTLALSVDRLMQI